MIPGVGIFYYSVFSGSTTGTSVDLFLMCCNMIVSSAVLMRYDQRAQGVEAQNQIEKWVDTHFDDARMKQIYPKAKSTH